MIYKISIIFTMVVAALATTNTRPCPRCSVTRSLPSANQSSTTPASVSTMFGTATLDFTTTIVTTITPSPTEASSKPVYTATQMYAYREGSPFHLLPIQARGLSFQLGGLPTTTCPSNIKDCPPGVLTGINNCEMVSTIKMVSHMAVLIQTVGRGRWRTTGLSQARRQFEIYSYSFHGHGTRLDPMPAHLRRRGYGCH